MVPPGNVIAPGPVCAGGTAGSAPTVKSVSPADRAINVPTSQNAGIGKQVSATFSQAMDPAMIVSSAAAPLRTFTLADSAGTEVSGNVAMSADNTVATFPPVASALATNTTYTARVTVAAKNAVGVAVLSPVAWSFVTQPIAAVARLPVNLGTAGNVAILAKSGISTVPNSAVTGDISVSPIDHTGITGFSKTLDSTNVFATSAQVTGNCRGRRSTWAPAQPRTPGCWHRLPSRWRRMR